MREDDFAAEGRDIRGEIGRDAIALEANEIRVGRLIDHGSRPLNGAKLGCRRSGWLRAGGNDEDSGRQGE
jgi:hypothetical protein